MFSFFERSIAPFPQEEPEQPPSGLFAFCRHYTRGLGCHLALLVVLTATLATIEVVLFGFMGQLVDLLNRHTPASLWQDEGRRLLTMAGLVLLGLPVTILLHSTLIHQALLGNYPMRIRWQAHRYMLGQSYAFYQNEFAGRIATKVMQTALAVRESVLKVLDVLLFVSVYFGGMVVVLAQSDLRLMVPLLVWLLGYLLTLSYFVPRLRDISTLQADARSAMVGRVVDSYTNISTVKLFSHSRREADYVRQSMSGFLDTVYPQMRLVTKLQVVVWTSNAVLIFAVAALSIWLWQLGSITTGAIAVSIGLALRLNGMSQWIMWEVSSLFENLGTVRDGINTLAKPRKVQDSPTARPLAIDRGRILFDRVDFSYGGAAPVFRNLCLEIQPGEKVGVVGRSGAGKSTLVNLLLRFYDLEGGAIRIDGQDIAGVQQESLRQQIGMVTQDTSLLHRSIRENILYGRPEASEAQLIQASKQAEAHEFILGLFDNRGRTGYDAYVGERGVKLSGGQRQRIAIARVLLKDAPILILDEATSALDSEIEAAIQASLYRLMANKTVIAIAHRLSTIAAMDRLIVLDQGKIVEQGSHAELIRHGGIYAQLWAHQSGGFIGTV